MSEETPRYYASLRDLTADEQARAREVLAAIESARDEEQRVIAVHVALEEARREGRASALVEHREPWSRG